MMDSETLIPDIESKIRKLVSKLQEAKEIIHQLNEENKLLTIKSEEQTNKIKDLEESIKLINITKAIGTQADAEVSKQKINDMLREIDKCIRLLNK